MRKKTGRWIRRSHLLKKDEFVCSACGASTTKPLPGCSRCGAVMQNASANGDWVDSLEALDAIFDD